MTQIPKSLKKYFWDVDFLELNPKKYPKFIIERILEYGDSGAVAWMRKNFNEEEIKKTIYTSRNLSRKSANFWQFIFNLSREKISCLKQLSQNKQSLIWKH